MGPYFKGQEPNECCGCYYPDCVRVHDRHDRPSGEFFRVMSCAAHGTHEHPIDGKWAHLADDYSANDLRGFRQQERSRLAGLGVTR